jgi:predicted amidohydrolase
MRIAAVAWKIRGVSGAGEYLRHLRELVTQAAEAGAEVVVLPELHGLELLTFAPTVEEREVPEYLARFAGDTEEQVRTLAQETGLVVVGGSHLKEVGNEIRNVCAIGLPGGDLVLAEKNNLTRYERDVWGLAGGSGLVVLPDGLGITVCYDSEFPEAGRALAEAGTLVHCVPAWTETVRGFQRVRWSCQARALENQIFAVHSSLVGDLGREPVPASFGSSAILAPSVDPFPESSVLAETPLNEEAVVVAELDFEMLEASRNAGEVGNWEDRTLGVWRVSNPTEITPSL